MNSFQNMNMKNVFLGVHLIRSNSNLAGRNKNHIYCGKNGFVVKYLFKIKTQNIKCSIYLIQKMNIKHALSLIFVIKNKSSVSNNKNYN